MATTEPHATGVRADDLQPLLDGRYASVRHQILELLSRPEGRGSKVQTLGTTATYDPAIRREVNRLCDEVRGDAEALVDAFGIPDEVLRAPIAVR